MGVRLKNLDRGVRGIKSLISAQAAKRHKEFAEEVLKAAKDIARHGVDNAHGTSDDSAYDTGKFHDSLSMFGTPGKTILVGSNDENDKVWVIEVGSDALGRFPKYIMGRAIGLAFDRVKTKDVKAFKVLKGVVSAV